MNTIDSILFHFASVFIYGWYYILIYYLLAFIGIIIKYKIKDNINSDTFLMQNYNLILVMLINIIINLLYPLYFDIVSIFNKNLNKDLSTGIITLSISIFIGSLGLLIIEPLVRKFIIKKEKIIDNK